MSINGGGDRVAHEEHLLELNKRREKALAMGGEEKLAKRKAEGHLNARERLDALLDKDTFVESGLFATSHRPEVAHKTPADGKIAGTGYVDGRRVAVVSNDFTVMGASSSVVNGKKIRQMREISTRHGMPLIFLGESAGARMPDRMGAAGRAILGQDPSEYHRERKAPWVSALLGDCYGSSTWYACMSDFVVMRKGATMAVASERVTSMAINQPVDAEQLGGWRLHTEQTGLVDVAADTDEQALQLVKKFLSYMPSHAEQLTPLQPVPEGSDEACKSILDIVPADKSQVYDVRKIISCLVDTDSMFELKPRFGKSISTVLARINGQAVGVVANNPMFKGAAIDVDACEKTTSFLVLCDSFNLPIIFLVDQPGFMIGLEGERRRAPSKIINWMNALSLVSVPKISVIMRKSYGQAYLNMGGGKNSDAVILWPTADLGFMAPEVAVHVLHGVKRGEDGFEELLEQVNRDASAWNLAALHEAQYLIDPRETRGLLKHLLAIHGDRLGRQVGEHKLSTWPTSY